MSDTSANANDNTNATAVPAEEFAKLFEKNEKPAAKAKKARKAPAHATLFEIKSKLLQQQLAPDEKNPRVSTLRVVDHLMKHVEEHSLLDETSLVIRLDQHLKELLETTEQTETVPLADLQHHVHDTLLVSNAPKI